MAWTTKSSCPSFLEPVEQRVHRGLVAHVAGHDDVRSELAGERSDALLQRLALVGERQFRARVRRSALAMPQAIDLSLARPMMRPRLPAIRSFDIRDPSRPILPIVAVRRSAGAASRGGLAVGCGAGYPSGRTRTRAGAPMDERYIRRRRSRSRSSRAGWTEAERPEPSTTPTRWRWRRWMRTGCRMPASFC